MPKKKKLFKLKFSKILSYLIDCNIFNMKTQLLLINQYIMII